MHQSRNFNVADMYFNVVCDNKILGENSEIIFNSILALYAFVIQHKTVQLI